MTAPLVRDSDTAREPQLAVDNEYLAMSPVVSDASDRTDTLALAAFTASHTRPVTTDSGRARQAGLADRIASLTAY